MNNYVSIAVLGAALALAGCGKSDEGAASGKAGDKSTAASAPVKREAGNWKTEVKLVKFDMPGAPAGLQDQMSKQFAAAGATEQCLTQEQADKEDVAAAMSKGVGEACTWSTDQIGGGKIDVAGTCTSNGQKVELAMTGTLEARKTDVVVTSKGAAPTGGQMEMQMQVTSTNTGPCKA